MGDVADGMVGVVLAAGAGTRLRPLTWERPKVLCPVGGVALVDLAVDRVAVATPDIAVNVHHGKKQLLRHLEPGAGAARSHPVKVSLEPHEALGTAGALGHLREWIGGRDVLVVNGDAWCSADLRGFVDGWDRTTIALLVHGDGAFHPGCQVAGALMPWSRVRDLAAEPSGLYEVSWRRAHAAGELVAVRAEGSFIDCGTPADYLAANLLASGGGSVIDPTATVAGTVTESVVWDGAAVAAGEVLVRAIRTTAGVTVLVR